MGRSLSVVCAVERGRGRSAGLRLVPKLSERTGLIALGLGLSGLVCVSTDPAAGHRLRLQVAGQLHPWAKCGTARLHCLQGLPYFNRGGAGDAQE